MFSNGEDDYQEDIPIKDSYRYSQSRKKVHISLRELVAFRIQNRKFEFGIVKLMSFILNHIYHHYLKFNIYFNFLIYFQLLWKTKFIHLKDNLVCCIGQTTSY